ncbi:MAG: helix-turn-helix domain-containing protein [Clostridia bacterium]|nr:helix-turn-helix domain-containing protein [Clostridia bacterium]
MGEFVKLFTSKRIELGLSQDEVADRLHVTRQAVSKWENGKAMPDIGLMPQIAELFGVSVDELLTGNEPAPRIEEKIVIQEKEVTKPMPARKILAIVAPIVLVVVLASALLGVYIPKAIAANTPPIEDNTKPEPPEIVYTEVFIKGKSNTDDSTFQAPLIENKAYYALNMRLSSEYTLYITAPKGAVATINGEVIAEFDAAKTIEHTQYFETAIFIEEELKPGEGEYYLSHPACKYYLEIDMTACDENDCTKEKQKIVVRQHMGFDNVTIPAKGTYFVALPMNNDGVAHHYVIKSSGIYYGRMLFHYMSVEDLVPSSFHIQLHAEKSTNDFYIVDNLGVKNDRLPREFYIGFVNARDEDVVLSVEEIEIETIELGQKVSVKGNSAKGYCSLYKLVLEKETVLLYKHNRSMHYSQDIIRYFRDKDILINDSYVVDIAENWCVAGRTTSTVDEGEIYIVVRPNDEGFDFVVDDWDKYF